MIDYTKPVALTYSGESVIILSTSSPVPDMPVIGYIVGTEDLLYFSYDGVGEAGELENVKEKDFTLFLGMNGEILEEGRHFLKVEVNHEKRRVFVENRQGYLVMLNNDRVETVSAPVEKKPEKPVPRLDQAFDSSGGMQAFLT